MNTPLIANFLVAQLDRASRLGAFRQGLEEGSTKGGNLTLTLYLLGATLLVILLYTLLKRRPRRHVARGTDYMAYGARLLRLDRSELRDLRTVATQACLTQPAALLLSPANLAHALGASQARRNDPQLRQRVDALSIRMFGSPLPKPQQPPTDTASNAGRG